MLEDSDTAKIGTMKDSTTKEAMRASSLEVSAVQCLPSEIESPTTELQDNDSKTKQTSHPVQVAEIESPSGEISSSIDKTVYPKGSKLALITLALCLAVFLFALDNTIIATAIPKITDQFSSLGDIGWYGSAYSLTLCAFQLQFGKLYTLYSIKKVFLSAVAIFTLGSLVCAAAPNSDALIIGRAIAGAGCAGIYSGSLIIIASAVPLHQRPIYTSIIGSMYGIASVVGPLLGGVFTDKLTWRWCFWINLPLGGATIAIILFFLDETRKGAPNTMGFMAKVLQLDLPGTLALLPAVVCLLLALQSGGTRWAWNSGPVIVLFVLGFILFGIFVALQVWKGDDATLPPRVLMQRSISSATLFSLCVSASLQIALYYMPVWFQAIKGTSAVESGIRTMPLILGFVVATIIGGGLVTVYGYYAPMMISSSVLMSVGAGLLTTLTPDSGSSQWIGFQVLLGLGVGLGLQQGLIAAQTVLPLKDVPSGTALIIFAQSFGSATCLAIGQTIFTNSLVFNLQKTVPGLDPAVVTNVGATMVQDVVPKQYWPGAQLAYNRALTAAFYLAIGTSCLSVIGSLFVEWKSVRKDEVEFKPTDTVVEVGLPPKEVAG